MGLLRFLLAISVIISHAGLMWGMKLVSGTMAVQSFFIISGFYISLVLNEKYIGKNDSYSLFISNRLLRIYPLYWLMLIVSFLLYLFVFVSSKSEMGYTMKYILDYIKSDSFNLPTLLLTLFGNLLIIGQDLVYFIKIEGNKLCFTENFRLDQPLVWKMLFIPQAWSVSLELMFYFIAPFILRKHLLLIITLIIASLSLRFFLYTYGLQHDPWEYRFFPTELALFLGGNISYHIYQKIRSAAVNENVLLFVSSLPFLFLFFLQFRAETEFLKWSFYAIIIFSIPFLMLATQKIKFDMQLGELSYPIYISHLLILSILGSKQLATIPVNKSFLTMIFSIAFSLAAMKFVINPIERIRKNRIS
jgi:peptidoglycan/LPS O-acetylase OafA/YrhL